MHGQAGCSFNGCDVSELWQINGICENPTLTMDIMNMNYNHTLNRDTTNSVECSSLISQTNISNCSNSHEWMNCLLDFDLSSYIDTSTDLDSANFIYLNLSTNNDIKTLCPYHDIDTDATYYLLMQFSVSCYVSHQCILDKSISPIISITLLVLFIATAIGVIVSGIFVAYKRSQEKASSTIARANNFSPTSKNNLHQYDFYENDGKEESKKSCDNCNSFEYRYDVELNNKELISNFCYYLPREIWKKKACYLPCITHLIDQATDIGVILDFYQLYVFETIKSPNGTRNDCSGVDARQLLILSCVAFLFYRIISCIWIYNITRSLFHTILQFFDLKIYHALYINFISEYNNGTPNTAQKYIQILEASLESFPQAVIQLYFFIQVGMDVQKHWIVFASLVVSIYNVSSKMTSEDTLYFVKEWKNICVGQNLNILYLSRFGIRLIDVFQRISFILLLWIGIGGLACAAYILFELFILSTIAIVTKDLSVLIVISQTPFQLFQSSKHWQLWYSLFLFYRATLRVVCISFYFFYSDSNSDVQFHNSTTFFIIVSFFGCSSIIVYVSIVLLYHLKIVIPLQGSTDRTVSQMIKNDLIKDIKELEMFGSRGNTHKINSFRHKNNESLWLRACKSVDIQHMKYLLSIDSNCNFNVNEQDSENQRTPIIYASIKNSVNAVKLLLDQADIDVNHRDKQGCSAVWYAAKYGSAETLRLLVEFGAEINTCDDERGETPILAALKQEKYEVVCWMLTNGRKYGLDMDSTDFQGRSLLFYCCQTANESLVALYNHCRKNKNNHDCFINTQHIMNAFEQNNIFLAKYLFENGKEYELDTSITDKNGQTLWVYCWKTKDVDLMMQYIEYHNVVRIEWNMCELDCSKTDNALTFNFSKIFTNDNGKFETVEEILLFELLITHFTRKIVQCARLHKDFEWPTNSYNTLLIWLFAPLHETKHSHQIATWKHIIGAQFFTILETITTLLSKLNNFNELENQLIETISKSRWRYFLHPSNSLQCLKQFIECNIDPNHPIKIENIDPMRYKENTVLIALARESENDPFLTEKCDLIMDWVKHEYTVSSENTIKFINAKDRELNATAIVHAIRSKNYHLAMSILKIFGRNVNVIDKYNDPHLKRILPNSTWLEILRSKQIKLIELALSAVLHQDNDATSRISMVLGELDLTKLDQKFDCTPLFWAVNHSFYGILQLMLRQGLENAFDHDCINVLNPLETDIINNSIWEYVSGLPNIYELLSMTPKQQQLLIYNIDDINIESMKLLIEEYKVDMNRMDSFGNAALHRICSLRYDKENFDVQFDTQYQAIKFLLENGAKIYTLRDFNVLTQDDYATWWRKLLLIVKQQKISVNERSLMQKYMSVIVFGDDEKYVIAEKILQDPNAAKHIV